jgi:hypothetical protein
MYNIPGKVNYVRKAALDIELSAGTMIDYTTWIPASAHAEYFGDQLTQCYDQLKIWVELDGEVLVNQSHRHDVVYVHHDFLDSDIQQCHELTIKLQGFQPTFNQTYQDKSTFVMVKVNSINIENLPMQYLIDQTGQYIHDNHIGTASQYIGHNGCWGFKFETPIYKWLLSRRDYIKVI